VSAKAPRRTRDGLAILNEITGKDPVLRERIADAKVDLRVAELIYETRTAAGLTQKQLADLIGSKQSAIARLEDADYEGHSLTMLSRIAAALHQTLEVRFVPRTRRERTSAAGR
jgi:ribosome-binding protein aMBF1 (putative translation factor)